MSFTSLEFPLFFLIFFLLYFPLRSEGRRWLLLVASIAFYMVFIPAYIFLIFGLIAVDYVAGRVIERTSGNWRKGILGLSLIANLGALSLFKYYPFVCETLLQLFASLHLPYHPAPLFWILPLGLSFHTFQSLSYIFEVYRGRFPAERNLLTYALYVLFWPQLVAGPIERPLNLIPPLRRLPELNTADWSAGFRLILIGLIKKIVIADRLAETVNLVYAHPQNYSWGALWLATYFFSFQIYCDFSGYTDIARGCAKLMGIDLMLNFNRPYLALSPSDFWRRWHISLSTWFRDYVYIPLGGRSSSRWRTVFNLLLVFTISGFWHGANRNFILWGAFHGTLVVLAFLFFGPAAKRLSVSFSILPRVCAILVTFHAITLGWVFFRAQNVRDALYILTTLIFGLSQKIGNVWESGLTPSQGLLRWALIFGLLASEIWKEYFSGNSPAISRSRWIRWSAYYAAIALILGMGIFDRRQFIYFQF